MWQDEIPEGGTDTGGDTGVDAVDTAKTDTADTGVKMESKQDRDALAKEVHDTAKTVEDTDRRADTAHADKVADTADTAGDTGKKPKDAKEAAKDDTKKGPYDRLTEYLGSAEFEKDRAEKSTWKIVAKVVLLFFLGQKAVEASMSTEEIDVKKTELVTAYTALVAELVTVGKLPAGITVDNTDVGILSGQYAISTADDLKKYLDGKVKMDIGTGPITIRDYLEKIEEKKNPTPKATAVAATGGATTTEAAPAVPPPLKGPKGDVDLVGYKTCSFKLANGGEVILGNKYIEMGGKRFAAKAKSGDEEADISFEKIRPVEKGGYAITIRPNFGDGAWERTKARLAGAQEVSLDQAAIVNLISTLYSKKDQSSFTHPVDNPATKEKVEFTFTVA